MVVLPTFELSIKLIYDIQSFTLTILLDDAF